MALQLTAVEIRILGCLLEKERVTPENYPLSLHSLTAACNQTSNRDPVTAYDEKTVEQGLDKLRGKKLATMVWGAGSRVQKYRHNFLDIYDVNPAEIAILCVLMLRGRQTSGELRARTERLYAFKSVQEIESCLEKIAVGDDPLVRKLPAGAGQKEHRYVQLFSGEPEIQEQGPSAYSEGRENMGRVETLENEVKALRAEISSLREEMTNFKRQFE